MSASNSKKEKRLKIRELNRKLSCIESERKFKWSTDKYQIAHKELLDSQEESIRKELEKIL